MSFGKKKKKAVQYEKFKDTPWITQGREIADIGGKGILDNYNKVNVFDEGTQASLDVMNNAIYQRAFDDMERNYTDIMNKYNAKNYNQFGTLNATAPSYVTDQYRRDFQREMDDLAYNKAVNYENLINNELQRRYNTLDMYHNLYQYGVAPHNVDIANWNTTNTNKSLAQAYSNFADSGNKLGNIATGIVNGASAGSVGGGWGALAGGIIGGIGGAI